LRLKGKKVCAEEKSAEVIAERIIGSFKKYPIINSAKKSVNFNQIHAIKMKKVYAEKNSDKKENLC